MGRGDNSRGIEKIIKEAAKGLRKDSTPAEKVLWEHLRTKKLGGYKFKRQQPIDKFVADFICFEKRLIIELDGEVHLSQKERDRERDNFLKESGFRVVRFPNVEIKKSIHEVLTKIKEELNREPENLPRKWAMKSPTFPSPPAGEGAGGEGE